ncbi:MAG TPA: hypothetical protein VLV32_07430 [Burkholderiales bacterium]|nr:hypothetical protein [Burkholderiales bacterium]
MLKRELKLIEARDKFGRPFAHEPGSIFQYTKAEMHTGIDWKKYRHKPQLVAVPESLKMVK